MRYCNKTCQHDHWRRGHKQMCKKIHRGGNAEQYHADKKYKEAVAEAVEACADDGNDEMRDVMSCLRTIRKGIEDKAAAELASLEVAPAETISCDLDSDCDIEVD